MPREGADIRAKSLRRQTIYQGLRPYSLSAMELSYAAF
jgi:hypothetical protein